MQDDTSKVFAGLFTIFMLFTQLSGSAPDSSRPATWLVTWWAPR